MSLLKHFTRLKEKTTIAGIAGALGSVLSIPAEYADPFEALVGVIISVLFIAFGDKNNPEGGTIDPIPEGGTIDPIPKDTIGGG